MKYTQTESEREDFEERAAIMEFDGGFNRYEAERRALVIVARKRGRLAKLAINF